MKFDRNGEVMCSYPGCRQHTKLVNTAHGPACITHKDAMKFNRNGAVMCSYPRCRKHTKLVDTEHGPACRKHKDSFASMRCEDSIALTSCDFVGCSEYGTRYGFGSYFCDTHHQLMCRISRGKYCTAGAEQGLWRMLEQLCRKHMDPSHWDAAIMLLTSA